MILCLLLRKRTQQQQKKKYFSTVKECDINRIMPMKMFYAKNRKKNIERQIIETFQARIFEYIHAVVNISIPDMTNLSPFITPMPRYDLLNIFFSSYKLNSFKWNQSNDKRNIFHPIKDNGMTWSKKKTFFWISPACFTSIDVIITLVSSSCVTITSRVYLFI